MSWKKRQPRRITGCDLVISILIKTGQSFFEEFFLDPQNAFLSFDCTSGFIATPLLECMAKEGFYFFHFMFLFCPF